MSRHLFYITPFLLLSTALSGQTAYLPLQRDLQLLYSPLPDSLHGFHASIQPYRLSELQPDSFLRSVAGRPVPSAHSPFQPLLKPLVFTGVYAGTRILYRTGLGAELQLDPAPNLNITLRYHADIERTPSEYAALTDSGFIPHYGKYLSKISPATFLFHDFTGYISWSPVKTLNFTLAKDRNFWGEGYRSLLLSDNSGSYPFFRTTFTAWRIKYVSLMAFFRDVELPGKAGTLHPKFGAFHYLSWNVTRTFNLSFFEAVVYRGSDSVQHRGFDFQYTIPVIFYRPVEFSLNSPDNMMLGMGSSWQITHNLRLYGQFMLDEFKLNDFLSNNGWWGNKYAIQGGMKIIEPAGIRGLHLLIEGNMARPYTYSHSSTLNNYGALYQPLAHPAGGNFAEGIVQASLLSKKNIYTFTFRMLEQGTDTAGLDYGSDVYRNYDDRIGQYDIRMLQGVKTTTAVAELRLSRPLVARWNLFLETGCTGLLRSAQGNTTLTGYLFLSLKTLLNNDEWFRY